MGPQAAPALPADRRGRIGVVGAGLIGGSVVRALLSRRGARGLVVFERDPDTRRALAAEGVELADGVAQLASTVELAFAAVPPDGAARVSATLLAADPAVVVTDVASIKGEVWRQMAAIPADHLARFVPGHPLVGRESHGWSFAVPHLFERAVWALSPDPERTRVDAVLVVADVVTRLLGARALMVPLGEHDAALAHTSHVPHLVASALVQAAAGDNPGLRYRLSGGALRDGTRVAAADGTLWGEILRLNRDEVVQATDRVIQRLAELRDLVADGAWEGVGCAWEAGVAAREQLTVARWTQDRPVIETTCPGSVAVLLQRGRDGELIHAIDRIGDHIQMRVEPL